MSEPSARTDLPEPLSGMPEQAVVELGAGLPWLTLGELNRVVRQQGLAALLARAWLLDQLARAVPLDPQREQQLIRAWLQERGVSSDGELEAWLPRQRLQRDDLVVLATQAERLDRFRRHRWGDEVEVQFLRRKPDLDQVVYSLLRTADAGLAEELHQRLAEGEADFGELATAYAEGRERHSRGLIGPLPLTAGHPEISARLRISQPGQLWPPFQVEQVWVILRLEDLLAARLTTETANRMLDELFESWLQDRIALILAGEPLPPLPAPPAANDVLHP